MIQVLLSHWYWPCSKLAVYTTVLGRQAVTQRGGRANPPGFGIKRAVWPVQPQLDSPVLLYDDPKDRIVHQFLQRVRHAQPRD
jgi:hypothetical protein